MRFLLRVWRPFLARSALGQGGPWNATAAFLGPVRGSWVSTGCKTAQKRRGREGRHLGVPSGSWSRTSRPPDGCNTSRQGFQPGTRETSPAPRLRFLPRVWRPRRAGANLGAAKGCLGVGGRCGRVIGCSNPAATFATLRHDSALLSSTHYLPVGDEEGHDAPNPGRHSWLGGQKEELPAVGAVVEALRVPVLPQQFAAMRAGAFHGLISGAEQ